MGTQLPLPIRGQSPQFWAHVYCGQTAGWIKMALGWRWPRSRPHCARWDGNPAPLPNKEQNLLQFWPIFLLWPNSCMCQDTTWYGSRPQPRRHCVRWDSSFPYPRGAQPPIFGQCLLWPNGWMDKDGTWHGGGPWYKSHCARWGPSSPLPNKGRSPPNFRPMFIVAKRLDGSRCHLVWRQASAYATLCLMRTQLPPEKKAHPIFGPCLLWPNGWMDEDAAWYGSRPRRRPHCTRQGPSSRKRGTAPSSFRPMSIVATVAHLSYCWALVLNPSKMWK